MCAESGETAAVWRRDYGLVRLVSMAGLDGDWQQRIEQLELQVAALQRKVFGNQDVPTSPRSDQADETWASAQVRSLAAEGNLIGAIKLLRSETGLSLREAKDVVERL